MDKAKLDATELRTIESYGQDAEMLFLREPPPTPPADDMKYAFSLVGCNPLLVDIGCGYGRVIPFISQIKEFNQIKEFKYSGIDPSKEMLQIARREYPGMDFREMSLYDLPEQFPRGHFDIALAITTLSNVTPAKMPLALKAIRKVIHKDGIGFFTFMNCDETIFLSGTLPRSLDYKGPAAMMKGWPVEEIIPLIEKSRFKVMLVSQYGLTELYSLVVKAT